MKTLTLKRTAAGQRLSLYWIRIKNWIVTKGKKAIGKSCSQSQEDSLDDSASIVTWKAIFSRSSLSRSIESLPLELGAWSKGSVKSASKTMVSNDDV